MKLRVGSTFKTRNGLSAVTLNVLPNASLLGYVTDKETFIPVNWHSDGSVVGQPDSDLAVVDPLDEMYAKLTDTDKVVLSMLYSSVAPGSFAFKAIARYFPWIGSNTAAANEMMVRAQDEMGICKLDMRSVQS